MGFFNNRSKHRTFDFIPRFYDPEKEKYLERRKKYGDEDIDETELMKQRIKSGFKVKGRKVEPQYRSKRVKKSNIRLLIVLAALIFISYIFFQKNLAGILESILN